MSFGSAFKRSWLLIVLCVVLCTGAGVAAGLLRSPEYTAEGTLFVGSLDVRTLAIPGFVTASQQLADVYGRVVTADPIVAPVSRRLEISEEEVRRRLSASNIPQSPVLRVTATGRSRRAALSLLRAATDQTVRYVGSLTRRNSETAQLFRVLDAAIRRAQRLEARAAQLRAENADRGAVINAQAVAETARVQATTAAGLYGEARANSAGAGQVRRLDGGVVAEDDRSAVLQRLIFLGVASGLILGAALAVLRQRRLVRQAA